MPQFTNIEVYVDHAFAIEYDVDTASHDDMISAAQHLFEKMPLAFYNDVNFTRRSIVSFIVEDTSEVYNYRITSTWGKV